MIPFTFRDFKQLVNGLLSKGEIIAMTVDGQLINRDMYGEALPPKLSELNPHLANWIRKCWQSQNDMWFVDFDDEEVNEIDENEWAEIEEQSEDNFEDSVEVFNPYNTAQFPDEYFVCCYGACINYVNWLNDCQVCND